MKPEIAIIGPGRVGLAMARLLHEAGERLVALVSRDAERARQAERFVGKPGIATTDLKKAVDAGIVMLAVPDDHLASVANKLQQQGLKPGTLLVHFSGFHPAAVLLDATHPGPSALAIHPLQTFADAVMGVNNLPGTPCSLEGDEEAIPAGEKLVAAIGGLPFRIRADQKSLYHAAACIASNYLVTNTKAACEVLTACGFGEEQAFKLLRPILAGTAHNLSTLGPDLALTGPISRGDIQTVRAHLVAMSELPGDLQQLYRVQGKKAVQMGQRRGSLEAEAAAEILRLLDDPPAI